MNDIDTLAKELNIPKKDIIKIYKAYWGYIKQAIEQLPLKEDTTEEQFNQLQSSVVIPPLGKLYCPSNKYWNKKKKYIKDYGEHKKD